MGTAKQNAAMKKARAAKTRGGFRKGSKSRTMPGKLDFTTKKTSKNFNRGGKRQQHALGSKLVRRPYQK